MQHVLKYIDFKEKFDSLTRTNSGSIELLDLSIYEHASKNASILLDIDPVSRKFQQADESLFVLKTMAHVPNIAPLFDECENYLIDCSNKQFCKDLIYTRLLYATKLMNRINRVTKSGKISADDLLAIISKSIGLVAITKDNMNAYRESMTFESIHQLKSQNQKVDSLDLDESDFILNVYRTVDGEYVNAEELMNELVVEFAHTLLSQTGYKGTSTTFKREYKNVYPFLGKRSNVVVLPTYLFVFDNCIYHSLKHEVWYGKLENVYATNRLRCEYKPDYTCEDPDYKRPEFISSTAYESMLYLGVTPQNVQIQDDVHQLVRIQDEDFKPFNHVESVRQYVTFLVDHGLTQSQRVPVGLLKKGYAAFVKQQLGTHSIKHTTNLRKLLIKFLAEVGYDFKYNANNATLRKLVETGELKLDPFLTITNDHNFRNYLKELSMSNKRQICFFL